MPALFAIIMSLVLCAYALVIVYKQVIKDAEKKASTILLNAKSQINAFASLDPATLNGELSRIFTLVTNIEIKSHISTRDVNADEELYLRSQVAFLEYFSGNINQINLRYGEDYLIKWFDLHYKTLESEGIIREMISKQLNENSGA